MSQLIEQKFESRTPECVPQLFSATENFSFKRKNGSLYHKSLPKGERGFHVISVKSTGHTASFVEHNRAALTIPISGIATVTVDKKTVFVKPDEMLLLGPSERHSDLSNRDSEHYESYTIISPVLNSVSCKAAEKMILHKQSAECQKIRQLLSFAFEFLRDEDQMSQRSGLLLEALVEETFQAYLHTWLEGKYVKENNSQLERIVGQAKEYMHESHSEPISITDIALAIGVGRASLYKMFRERCGITLREYLTGLRLDSMRKSLQNPGPCTTVASAAMDAGFFHLGRSSAAYRDRFAELPSTTLRNIRKIY